MRDAARRLPQCLSLFLLSAADPCVRIHGGYRGPSGHGADLARGQVLTHINTLPGDFVATQHLKRAMPRAHKRWGRSMVGCCWGVGELLRTVQRV
jgi:hypothetical protein